MKLLKKIIQILLRRNPSNLADLCIVGLGNPGDKHFKTRHNLGYDFVELIAQRFNAQFSKNKKLDASIAEFNFEGKSILLVKPNAFINLSGKTLGLIKKYKVNSINKVLVVHDDMDLKPSDVKLKVGGSDGGHNGLKDIIKTVGKDFIRLRFGIGHPAIKADTNAWVIKKPSPEEQKLIADSFDKAIFALDDILNLEWLLAMNKLHSK